MSDMKGRTVSPSCDCPSGCTVHLSVTRQGLNSGDSSLGGLHSGAQLYMNGSSVRKSLFTGLWHASQSLDLTRPF